MQVVRRIKGSSPDERPGPHLLISRVRRFPDLRVNAPGFRPLNSVIACPFESMTAGLACVAPVVRSTASTSRHRKLSLSLIPNSEALITHSPRPRLDTSTPY